MPKFTTPCFVRVEDAQKRKELTQWLEEIGYKEGHPSDEPCVLTQAAELTMTYLAEYVKTAVDCGTNIELFKALAGMRSDTDNMQWFVAQSNIMFKKLKGEVVTASKKRYISVGEMFMPLIPNVHFTWFGRNTKQLFRKATTAEIIEHFKTKTK